MIAHYPVRIDHLPFRFAAPGGLDDLGDPLGPAMPTHERLLGKRVLVVEDEALLALELRLAMEDEGAEVIGPAQSIFDALDAVTHVHEIDVAVLDINLAGESVYPVAELLHQRAVPFVFHTGHGLQSELAALFPGTTTFIKPTLPETLIGHVARIAL